MQWKIIFAFFAILAGAAVPAGAAAAAQQPDTAQQPDAEPRPLVTREADSTYAASIGEVTVTGRRPVVKVGDYGLSYDLGALTAARTAANVWEALAELPGVRVQGDALELVGAGGVTLLLDGRPSTMDGAQLAALLRTMPVERVARTEVMYSAPPHFHVRGAAINIVLHRRRDFIVAGELHGGGSHNRRGSWDAGGSLLVTSPGWSADVGYTAGRSARQTLLDLVSHHTLDGVTHRIGQHQRLVMTDDEHRLRAAVEYAPEGRSQLGAAYTALFTPGSRGETRAEGDFVRSSFAPNGDHAMHNVALHCRTTFGLDLSVDYTHYRASRQAAMRSSYADGRESRFDVASGQRVDRLKAAIDRTRTFASGWQLGYGGSAEWARDADWQFYTLHEGEAATVDTDSRIDEYAGALYASLGRQFRRVGLSLSLTGEYWRSAGRDDTALYPQMTLLWMPAEEHLVQATLSSDKRRPPYWAMQQAVSYIDGYAEIRGTLGLRPSRRFDGQLLYMFRRNYLFVLFWNETRHHFEQAAWQASDRLALVYQTLNWNFARQWGATAVVPVRLGEGSDIRLTFSALNMRQRCDEFHDLSFDRRKWIGAVQVESGIRLSRKPALTLELSGLYHSPAIQATYDTEAVWNIGVGAKWSFAHERATLTFRAEDLFERGVPDVAVRFGGQWLDLSSGAGTRTFSLRFAWRFGRYRERERKEVDTSRFGH